MTDLLEATTPRQPDESLAAAENRRQGLKPLVEALSFRKVSALYLGIVFVITFSIWIPDLFWTSTTWRTLVSEQAIVAMVAIGLVVSLAAGAFDLSIGLAVGVGSMISAWLLGPHGFPIAPAVALGTLAGSGVGIVNALLVTRVGIDSFIATLGVSSCLIAALTAISDGQQIIGLPTTFQDLAATELLGITLPVYLMLLVAVVAWYVLEHTPAGRYVYATGGNQEAARLTGVPTTSVVVLALIAGSTIAAFGGVLFTARTGASSPDVGPGYLLPAFAAAFLGSTQIRNGRFNVWGTVLAVYVLAIGVKGLQLAGAPYWLPDLFNGVALLVAVGIASYRGAFRARLRGGVLRRLRGDDRAGQAQEGEPAAPPGT